mmetsp:Transcript_10967/g.38176  ORF Transcript_10967/g.38176 Transcript_10967/m.38176 type:complete len:246 (+) Transcript_10967:946-1683(+)
MIVPTWPPMPAQCSGVLPSLSFADTAMCSNRFERGASALADRCSSGDGGGGGPATADAADADADASNAPASDASSELTSRCWLAAIAASKDAPLRSTSFSTISTHRSCPPRQAAWSGVHLSRSPVSGLAPMAMSVAVVSPSPRSHAATSCGPSSRSSEFSRSSIGGTGRDRLLAPTPPKLGSEDKGGAEGSTRAGSMLPRVVTAWRLARAALMRLSARGWRASKQPRGVRGVPRQKGTEVKHVHD